ncbi:TRAP transporter substrate-binding protein [Fusobacterium ulcerans]|uniref:TRAP transporter substrate-binding protein n=1 Tax=Fusobacterium ulcerans TaxID=861 RepID=UPI0026DBE47B|nr:TRAP transporter substrate-binding protein [Fusobacterium ulcerans]
MKKFAKFFLSIGFILGSMLLLTSCNVGNGKTIIRVSHNQAADHPTNIGLLAFEEFIESKLGDKYDVQIFPNELLGSQVNTVELTQTGAINFTVASNAILESFDDIYQIFNLPYLFNSPEHYHTVMDNKELIKPIFTATEKSGFEAVAWLDAGTRNFYTVKKPIRTPDDLKGLKIRVQQSASNIRMMELFGGAATPMGFGEVYTALQQSVIDGAENNELALTSNKHGEVCKYYSYNMHQMVPDIVIGNIRFLNSLSHEERAIFDEGFKIISKVQREAWGSSVEKAIEEAKKMNVKFIYPDVFAFQEKVLPLHKEVLDANPKLKPIYDRIQEIGKEVIGGKN